MKRTTKKVKALPFSKFIEPPQPARIQLSAADKKGILKALDAIEALFGPKGKYWTKGHFREDTGVENIHSFCLVGAAREANGAYENAAHMMIALALDFDPDWNEGLDMREVEDVIIDFNDDNDTKWRDVKKVLNRARTLTKKA